MQAAELFTEGVAPPEVARRPRVSPNSAYAWRRRWRAGGETALASKGPGGAVCRLSGARLQRLRAALEGGPAMWGWDEDQRWTLARVTTLIGRLFHVRYTLRGTSYLLHRLGFTPQVPVRPALIESFLAQTGLTLEPQPPQRGRMLAFQLLVAGDLNIWSLR